MAEFQPSPVVANRLRETAKLEARALTGPFSQHVKFYSFIFLYELHKISTQVVSLNGNLL